MRLPKTCSQSLCADLATYRGRCARHAAEHEASERATVPTKASRTRAEQARRAQAVADHRAQHGEWCPGYGRPAHAATDLTADHRIAVADGGPPDGPLDVLCRSCNSRKGACSAP
jgi:5-methylcytosine-specific restriction protein A